MTELRDDLCKRVGWSVVLGSGNSDGFEVRYEVWFGGGTRKCRATRMAVSYRPIGFNADMGNVTFALMLELLFLCL